MAKAVLIPKEQITALCLKFEVTSLAIFGSATREDSDPNTSDFDFLVEFSNTLKPGYSDRYLGLAEGLEKLLGRKVDLLTTRSLKNPYLISRIESEKIQVYAA